jgi:hypothetical protein
MNILQQKSLKTFIKFFEHIMVMQYKIHLHHNPEEKPPGGMRTR